MKVIGLTNIVKFMKTFVKTLEWQLLFSVIKSADIAVNYSTRAKILFFNHDLSRHD